VVVVVVTVFVSTHSASSIWRLVVRRATALLDSVQLLPASSLLIENSSIEALSGVASTAAANEFDEEPPVKSGCGRALVFSDDVVRRRDEGRKGGSIRSIMKNFRWEPSVFGG